MPPKFDPDADFWTPLRSTTLFARDPELLVGGLRTVDEDLAQFVASIRLLTTLLGGFGVVGLLLATLGVFGTMSYAVSQRERELAVRAALGAGRRDLLRLVMRGGFIVTLAGLGPGVLLAVRNAKSQRFPVRSGTG